MKTKPVVARLLACILLTFTSAAFATGDDHTPKHGGVVVETKLADFEFVVKPDIIQIYLRDHGKPMRIDGGKAKVTLLNGSEKTEIELGQPGGLEKNAICIATLLAKAWAAGKPSATLEKLSQAVLTFAQTATI